MTAKEFLLKEYDGYLSGDYVPSEVYPLMIEFAKMHLEAFKKEIKDNGYYMTDHDGWDNCVDTTAINNLYSLENIK